MAISKFMINFPLYNYHELYTFRSILLGIVGIYRNSQLFSFQCSNEWLYFKQSNCLLKKNSKKKFLKKQNS